MKLKKKTHIIVKLKSKSLKVRIKYESEYLKTEVRPTPKKMSYIFYEQFKINIKMVLIVLPWRLWLMWVPNKNCLFIIYELIISEQRISTNCKNIWLVIFTFTESNISYQYRCYLNEIIGNTSYKKNDLISISLNTSYIWFVST